MDYPLCVGFVKMDKPSFKLVGAPCGQHGQYTFYKALRIIGEKERIVAIGDFFFVRIWQDSELVSIGELQLLWTDRVSDQTLVSLRLYFLPENTPDGRNQHGEHEVLAINEKVVVRADDLMSWICAGGEWRWGLRAVWRGACAPPAEPRDTAPLHHTKLDFTDVDKEKSSIVVDSESPGVVVFSYPRYCRYRALLSRLDGIQADWLRDSLVAALGGYAAPTNNTRILYCKDTFEYPELEGHEFVCSHLAPRLRGRGRGRRRRARAPPDPSHEPAPALLRSDSDDAADAADVADAAPLHHTTPRRLSLRNGGGAERERERGGSRRSSGEASEREQRQDSPADCAFLHQLRIFYRDRNQIFKPSHSLKDLSLFALYQAVRARGGYEAVCRRQLWRALAAADQPARTRRHYERYLLPYENHERRSHLPYKLNGRIDEPHTIATIDVTDSPQREGASTPEKTLRTPSPKPEKTEKPQIDNETGELTTKEDILLKNAEQLNQEFLDSLPKDEKLLKISVKPVEKLIEPKLKLFEENSAFSESAKRNASDNSDVIDSKEFCQGNMFLSALAQKLNLGTSDTSFLKDLSRPPHAPVNGHATNNAINNANANTNATASTIEQKNNRPVGKSSLRAVRVKPTRQQAPPSGTPPNPLRPDSASSSPPLSSSSLPPPPAPPTSSSSSSAPLTNFGIHHPPVMTPGTHSDDEIVEVPYKPKTPEIIDLDEYPESPQSIKKKKLDILKERGLEVTALPTPAWQPLPAPINPPLMLNPAVQHQIMTQAQLFQMYNIMPQNYSNGIQPPKVIQGSSVFGTAGPEKTVYGNPKDPFMPPPHILLGAPLKPLRTAPPPTTVPQDILDLTCKSTSPPPQKPAVEIVRVPTSPTLKTAPQNLSKNYQLIDGKAVVGSNLEITLVNKTPVKNRAPQKRSSNGKFMSSKTPTPPKDTFKYSPTHSTPKKPAINIPSYQIREANSPNSSTQSPFKSTNLSHIMDMQKGAMPMASFMDPYMALYNVAGQIDPRQLAMYRDLMANQFRGYPGLLNLGVSSTPTTKN